MLRKFSSYYLFSFSLQITPNLYSKSKFDVYAKKSEFFRRVIAIQAITRGLRAFGINIKSLPQRFFLVFLKNNILPHLWPLSGNDPEGSRLQQIGHYLESLTIFRTETLLVSLQNVKEIVLLLCLLLQITPTLFH